MKWIFSIVIMAGGLYALEANMFQQQAWNVYQQQQEKQRKATFTATPTKGPALPTATITQTPDPKLFTPSPTVTNTPKA